jgi:poly(3-hydroxybutyrate) depolymerase
MAALSGAAGGCDRLGAVRIVIAALVLVGCGRDNSPARPDAAEVAAPTPAPPAAAAPPSPARGGCGSPPPATGVTDESIEVGGRTRHFVLSVPDDDDGNTPRPVIYLLHGAGSEGHQFRFYAGVEAAADAPAIYVYPDGLPFQAPDAKTGWDLRLEGIDLPFLDAIHAQLLRTHCVDEDRVFATGHSFGAWMTNLLGCVRGDRFRAVAPVAGGGPADGCSGHVAAWVAHGIDDPIVPTSFGEATAKAWREANGCGTQTAAVPPTPCVAYTGCAVGDEVHWCLHDESFPGLESHTWPSFAGAGIWAFFAAH